MLFHNETEDKALQKRLQDSVVEEEEVHQDEELASTEPLLTPQSSPVLSPLQSVGGTSPFVVLEEPQVEVEIETEGDITVEEAEEATESPLNKRLSMSLITCHEGATSSQIFAEVHHDSTSSPVPYVDAEPLKDGVDHSYALPSVNVEAWSPTEPSLTTNPDDAPVPTSPAQPEEAEKDPSPAEPKGLVKESSLPPASAPSELPAEPNPEQPQPCTTIRCPTFDSKSPSQVVFKPQWLGRGFGATGLRARGVQGRSGKGGSSPLAVRVAVKNVTNENKGLSGKLKQKGVHKYFFLLVISKDVWCCLILLLFFYIGSEGRSPLQILKETNSPRDRPQVLYTSICSSDANFNLPL